MPRHLAPRFCLDVIVPIKTTSFTEISKISETIRQAVNAPKNEIGAVTRYSPKPFRSIGYIFSRHDAARRARNRLTRRVRIPGLKAEIANYWN